MSLLFPAYLFGLAALGLPWILHRFSNQQPQVLLFPSKRFLEATTPPVSRKRTLRYRVLLALRLLSLLLLCLLFAQPWIRKSALPLTQQQHHFVVIDQSLSMRAEGRWKAALRRAGEIINDLDDANAELVGFDTGVKVLASSMIAEQSVGSNLNAALDDLQPGYFPGDYGLLMQRIDRLASERNLPVKVWLVSDMQNSALPAQLNALYAPNVAELELVSIPVEAQTNVHLTAQAESSDGATGRVNVTLLASTTDPQARTEPIVRTVQIEAEQRIVEKRKVSLVPGELQLVNFDKLVLPAVSDPQFTVSLLEKDALEEDNSQRLGITKSQPSGIVLLNAPGDATASAAVFLTTALETDDLALVEPIQGTAMQIPPDTAHLVTGKDLSKRLDVDILQFVDTGSNVLVFNRAVSAPDNSTSVEGVGMGTVDEAHPLALGDIDWFGTQFYEVPELAIEQGDRPLLQTVDGQNILIERPTNRGRLLILNDPLDGMASNLPLQPAFVELMQSLMRFFDASTTIPSMMVIGDRLALPENVQLIDASGKALLDMADRAGPATLELTKPGSYTLVSVRGEQNLQAVLDINETDLTPMAPDAIAAWQARYAAPDDNDSKTNLTASTATRIKSQAVLGDDDPVRQALWHWILPMLALSLFAEGWFANRRLDVRRDGS